MKNKTLVFTMGEEKITLKMDIKDLANKIQRTDVLENGVAFIEVDTEEVGEIFLNINAILAMKGIEENDK